MHSYLEVFYRLDVTEYDKNQSGLKYLPVVGIVTEKQEEEFWAVSRCTGTHNMKVDSERTENFS